MGSRHYLVLTYGVAKGFRSKEKHPPRLLRWLDQRIAQCRPSVRGDVRGLGAATPPRNSILPMLPVFINRCGAERHGELILIYRVERSSSRAGLSSRCGPVPFTAHCNRLSINKSR